MIPDFDIHQVALRLSRRYVEFFVLPIIYLIFLLPKSGLAHSRRPHTSFWVRHCYVLELTKGILTMLP